MSAANQQLGFAIRAVNEAQRAMLEIQNDLGDVEKAAIEASSEMGSFQDKLYGVGEAGGNLEQSVRGVSDILGVMNDQFGISLGPLEGWAGAVAEVGGGVEGILKGGPALIAQLSVIPATLGPAIAGTWAYVAALTAQAAAFIVANAPIILLVAGIAALVAGIVLLVTHWDTITEKVPLLGDAFDAAKKVVLDVKDKVIEAFKAVPDWLKDNWPLLAAIISGPFAPLVLLATDAFGIRSALVGAFTGLISDIIGFARDAVDAGKAIGSAIKDGIVQGLGGIVDKAQDIAASIINALKAAWNAAIDWADQNFKLHIPGLEVAGKTIIPDTNWDPNLAPLKLATGGIVTRPTFALIGEAGPEAVVPLSGPNAPKGIGGVTVVIQALDARSFEDWLNRGGGDVMYDYLSRRRAV